MNHLTVVYNDNQFWENGPYQKTTSYLDHPYKKEVNIVWRRREKETMEPTSVRYYFLYNNMRGPSKLTHGADFYCFKHNIEPKWEDPICANGGK
ncbi:hypothetical protein YC2023_031467 [Brassica napus]